MIAVDMMRTVRFQVYLKVELDRFPCGLGYEVQEKRSSQARHHAFWFEKLGLENRHLLRQQQNARGVGLGEYIRSSVLERISFRILLDI